MAWSSSFPWLSARSSSIENRFVGWSGSCTHVEWVARSLERVPIKGTSGEVKQANAANRDYSSLLINTDPPYYDNIGYSDLSDFFYVWLRRTIGDFLPAIFTGDTTPKDEEVCEMSGWDPVRYSHKDKIFFEREMTTALRRGRQRP